MPMWMRLCVLVGLAAGIARGENAWVLATGDTEVRVEVSGDGVYLAGMRSPGVGWEWVKKACPVPMPKVEGVTWKYQGAEVGDEGRRVKLRFAGDGKLEMVSEWSAVKGAGPVENEVVVVNRGEREVVFEAGEAADLNLVADEDVTVHYADKTQMGRGVVHEEVLGANAKVETGREQIPFLILNVRGRHGVYFGYEWELGGFRLAAEAGRIEMVARPVTERVRRGPGQTYVVPAVYYGAYAGDVDDGANSFKRWFWANKITRSLRENAGEPWVEVCMQEIGGTGASSVTAATPQGVYDKLAATGAECVKMDFWDGTGQCWYTERDWQYKPAVWPKGFDFAAKAHKAGLKAALYMGGTYRDVDLSTAAGRVEELAAVMKRFDAEWFDAWRTDRYTAPNDPIPDTYEGVTNFLAIQDAMIAHAPGYRYENCCNGGRYKGFAICRRMTFCTMNDDDGHPANTRSTYYSNSFAINPVQLKSDLGPTSSAYQMRTDMLGSILTWASDSPVYREHIKLYKERQRPILRGACVYHVLPMADGVNWDGLEFYNPDIERGSVFVFKPSAKAKDGDARVVKLKGLVPAAKYRLTFQDRKNLDCVKSGAELMGDGILVSGMVGDEASEIIWVERVSGP